MQQPISLGVVILAVLAAAPAGAQAGRALAPRPPSPSLSARFYEDQCAGFQANKSDLISAARAGTPCAATRGQVSAFCEDPLGQPIPSQSELQKANDKSCQEPVGATARVQSDAGLGSVQWQQDVLRGVAAFLVARANSEAVAAFMDNLKANVCVQGEGTYLLPLTCQLLAIGDPYAVGVSGALKSTLEGDLQQLPYRYLDRYVPASSDPKYLDARELVASAAQVVALVVENGEQPINALTGLEDKYQNPASCETRPVSCALLAVGVAAQVLADIKSETPPTDRYFRIATRLAGERLKKDGVLPAAFDFKQAGGLESALRAFSDSSKALAFATQRAEQGRKSLLLGTGDSRAVLLEALNRFAAYARALGDLAAVGEQFVRVTEPFINSPERWAQTAEVFAVARRGAHRFEDSLDAMRKQDYIRAVVSVTLIASDIGGLDQSPPWLKRYGPFVAQIAVARSSDEVKSALEAAAVPVGSYRLKRGDGKAALTINGYLGVQGGYEWLGASDLPAAGSPQLGVFGPVGIEGALGFGGEKSQQSIGLFLSVIDVGALADFRLSPAAPQPVEGQPKVTVDQVPSFGFAQVFSPGLYVVYGVPSWPLVLGAGVSLTPGLRRVNLLDTGTARDVPSLRVGGFAAIDVTLFGL